ncbi:uncharacterized protein LOC118485749 [Helianthus annuus]|uniref:uncharacterized protein LOC118485749 n=1 Tax=Helianthus annuus TaxID=4232 RepID=UPI001652FC85|nr:uncharacterized protein LOC118485749 [Helianthus annuus]
MVNGPRYSAKEKGKHPYEPSWQEQQVIFPVVRDGPRATRPVVITGIIGHYETEYIFIDPRSTDDIIYQQCFNQFDEEDKARLEPVDYPLSGFCNEMVFPLGQISFPVTLSDGKHSRTTSVNFMVMPVKSRHDVLIGRETQGELNMVTSTPHSAIGFPTKTGVAIICAKKEVMSTEELRPAKAAKVSATEPEKWVLNRKYPEQTVTIGHTISSDIRTRLKQLLCRNMDIFVWTPADMTGVPRNITEHCLNTYPSVEPKVQRRRSLGADKTKAMNEQVCELLKAGILREVRYQSWVANPVMVEKSNGGWRICVDYTDLHKACPKDCYSLPEIDKKIDSLAPYRWKCFLDCYKGYHQVQMKLEDEDKTAFRTDLGIFCYTKMPFGLNNDGATYQRLMDKTFAGDIGKHIEVYIDDLVVKSHEEDQMLKDIEKTFNSLRSKPETSGRLAKWAIELGGHNILYRPRPAIKGQILADFITEVPVDKIKGCELIETPEKDVTNETWMLYTDGASNEDGAGAGLRLVSPENHEFTYAINQVNGIYDAKGEVMALYLEQAKELLQQFQSHKVIHINRSENKLADALSKLASTSFQHLAKDVRIEVLKNPSVLLRQVNVIEMGQPSWMTPIIQYLQEGILLENRAEARKIQNKSLHYEMNGGILYRKSFLGPLLRYVDPQDANYLIREIHEGICGIHSGPRMVVTKIMNAGYYWTGMHVDALKEIRKCDSCQRHSPKTLRPKNDLIPVSTAWPFQQWGIDMVGPFPEAPVAVKFIIVVVDYFMKWVEAKALASTTAMMVRKFI